MSRLADLFNKPEYVFRPRQLARRFGARPSDGSRPVVVPLSWGLPLRVRPDEVVGRAIWNTGLYDLVVSETLWRLAESGETAVDAGANIGCYTSLLAKRVGPGGEVRAYEPHPAVFADLWANAALWPSASIARLQLRQAALSDTAGEATLLQSEGFESNRGGSMIATDARQGLAIERVTLDAELAPQQQVGVLKIDVEGHEGPLLRGAARALRTRQIRDVLFEEQSPTPGEASRLLVAAGYTLFRIFKGFFGPTLASPDHRLDQALMPPSFLATADPARAVARLTPRGWRCLQ